VDAPRGIDLPEAIFLAQLLELVKHALLILNIAFIIVIVAQEIHPRFPVIESPRPQHPGHQVFQVRGHIEHRVRHQGESHQLAQPLRIHPSHRIARDQRVHVAVGQHNKPGA